MKEYISQKYDVLCMKIRETLNPYLGGLRLKCGRVNPSFTIISNNCWAGHVYRYFNVPYQSPTIGLFIFSPDYVKFCSNLKAYLSQKLQFIDIEESQYKDILRERNNDKVPIARLGDIEIIFLHYHSIEEARDKWTRRVERINWDNLYFKMSEQNLCSIRDMKAFDSLPYKNKFIFVSKDYGLESQIIFKDYLGQDEVPNDTTHFRRFINLKKFLTHKPYKLRQ